MRGSNCRRSRLASLGFAVATLAASACGSKNQPSATNAAVNSDAIATSDATDTSMSETPVTPIGRGGSLELYPAALLSSIDDQLSRGAATGKTVAAHPTLHYVEARRISNGGPEVHDRWIDVTIVQAGHATLLVGGHVKGSHLASPGEHRGGTIVGGATQAIGPGDLFTIPAGVPHQFDVARGDSVRYLTIKVLQPPSGMAR